MLKVGLLGVGYLGKIHLGLLTGLENIQLMGFYDTDSQICSELELKYQLPHFAQSIDLINQCDALVIAVPTAAHFEYVKTCIQLGKHVFVEKPVTANVEEAYQLKEVLKGTSIVLQIGMVERFNPAFVATQPFVGPLTRIYSNRLAPFTPRGADVSVVFDVMIHDLDIVLSLVKSEIKKITAFGEKIISSTFDVSTAVVEFEDGTVAHFTASRMAERKYRLLELFQEERIYQVDFLNKKTLEFRLKKQPEGSIREAYLARTAGVLEENELSIKDTNAIEEELKSFADSILNNKKVVVSLDDGISAMELAAKIEAEMNHQN